MTGGTHPDQKVGLHDSSYRFFLESAIDLYLHHFKYN